MGVYLVGPDESVSPGRTLMRLRKALQASGRLVSVTDPVHLDFEAMTADDFVILDAVIAPAAMSRTLGILAGRGLNLGVGCVVPTPDADHAAGAGLLRVHLLEAVGAERLMIELLDGGDEALLVGQVGPDRYLMRRDAFSELASAAGQIRLEGAPRLVEPAHPGDVIVDGPGCIRLHWPDLVNEASQWRTLLDTVACPAEGEHLVVVLEHQNQWADKFAELVLRTTGAEVLHTPARSPWSRGSLVAGWETLVAEATCSGRAIDVSVARDDHPPRPVLEISGEDPQSAESRFHQMVEATLKASADSFALTVVGAPSLELLRLVVEHAARWTSRPATGLEVLFKVTAGVAVVGDPNEIVEHIRLQPATSATIRGLGVPDGTVTLFGSASEDPSQQSEPVTLPLHVAYLTWAGVAPKAADRIAAAAWAGSRRRPVVVFAPPYAPQSAGIRVLLRLPRLLAERGHHAGIARYWGHPSRLEPEDVANQVRSLRPSTLARGVAVLPETFAADVGLELQVLWLLNRAGYLPDSSDTVKTLRDSPDLTVAYSAMVDRTLPRLHVSSLEFDLFRPKLRNGVGSAFYMGKSGLDVDYEPPAWLRAYDPIEITREWPSDRRTLAALLREIDVLFSFDPMSAINTEATLCGTPVVLTIPPGSLWKRADLEAYDLGSAGFAWSRDPDEIQRARGETLGLHDQMRQRARALENGDVGRLSDWLSEQGA